MKLQRILSTVLFALACGAPSVHAADPQQSPQPLQPVPARPSALATEATMLGAAWAGPRAVAVGDHGVVVLSDDGGTRFRQARSVPVSSLLTAVSFADAQHGWAVGHWGAILHSADGGETWATQRLETGEDRPLFAVHFFDARHGVAVGLWSLVLVTEDSGQHWQAQTLPPPPGAKKADLNLLGLFADAKGSLYATAERGQLLRSDDRGRSWRYLDTGYKGSLWSGAALADGSLLVGGQRGTLLRSSDDGRHWSRVAMDSKSSVTGIAASASQVTVIGLDGLLAQSRDGGATFEATTRADGVSLTAALARADGRVLLFSRRGVVEQTPRSGAAEKTP